MKRPSVVSARGSKETASVLVAASRTPAAAAAARLNSYRRNWLVVVPTATPLMAMALGILTPSNTRSVSEVPAAMPARAAASSAKGVEYVHTRVSHSVAFFQFSSYRGSPIKPASCRSVMTSPGTVPRMVMSPEVATQV